MAADVACLTWQQLQVALFYAQHEASHSCLHLLLVPHHLLLLVVTYGQHAASHSYLCLLLVALRCQQCLLLVALTYAQRAA
jgi:hypothetical protein